jgi:hypothetical protein
MRLLRGWHFRRITAAIVLMAALAACKGEPAKIAKLVPSADRDAATAVFTDKRKIGTAEKLQSAFESIAKKLGRIKQHQKDIEDVENFEAFFDRRYLAKVIKWLQQDFNSEDWRLAFAAEFEIIKSGSLIHLAEEEEHKVDEAIINFDIALSHKVHDQTYNALEAVSVLFVGMNRKSKLTEEERAKLRTYKLHLRRLGGLLLLLLKETRACKLDHTASTISNVLITARGVLEEIKAKTGGKVDMTDVLGFTSGGVDTSEP